MPSTVLKLHSGHNFHTKKIYKGAKISQSVSELLSRHNFPAKIFKGHNSVKTACGVTVLVLCILPDGALYLY